MTGDDEFADLVAAAGSSTGFWDNPLDDEDWNVVPPPADPPLISS